jgi:hypothetical protein
MRTDTNKKWPTCSWSYGSWISNYAIKHVLLIDCVDAVDVRQTFYNVNNLYLIYLQISRATQFLFFKEINLYTKYTKI